MLDRFFIKCVYIINFILGGSGEFFVPVDKHTWTLFCNAAPLLGHSFRYCFYELLGQTTVMLIEGTIPLPPPAANDKHLVLSDYSNLCLLGCSRLAGENRNCESSEYYPLYFFWVVLSAAWAAFSYACADEYSSSPLKYPEFVFFLCVFSGTLCSSTKYLWGQALAPFFLLGFSACPRWKESTGLSWDFAFCSIVRKLSQGS